MKIKKLLCGLALASITSLSVAPISSCSNSKYSQTVRTVVEKLVDLDKYPRCTSPGGHREYLMPIRLWIVDQVIKSGLTLSDVKSDDYGNVWFDVPASSGYENYKTLILQGHMDMVVAGLEESEKATTPIDVEVEWDKDIVHSKDYKTTLGADNGVSLAIIFTLLQDSSFKHGPLRVIFTADEDSGMIGASQIAENHKYIISNVGPTTSGEKIEYLLNVDAEHVGHAYRSCFGSTTYTYYNAFTPVNTPAIGKTYSLNISGLHGGHSGVDLPKGYASAEKMAYEILYEINNKGAQNNIQLVNQTHIKDGKNISFQRNQIVTQCQVVFNTEITEANIKTVISNKITQWKETYKGEDWNSVKVEIVTPNSASTPFISIEDSNTIITQLGRNIPPDDWSESKSCIWYGFENDASGNILRSGNLAPVEIWYDSDASKIYFYATSQYRTKTNAILDHMDDFYSKIQLFTPNVGSHYPAWEYDGSKENKLIDMVGKSYQNQGVEFSVEDCSGGIETSWWQYCNDTLHTTGIGPTIDDAHSTSETLHISTIEPVINVIKYVCEQMKK